MSGLGPTNALILALPSKGRLQEASLAFFARAGLDIVQARGARDYAARIAGLDGVVVQFRSASEIAGEVGAGNVHLAVTGADLLHETLGPPTNDIPAEASAGRDDRGPAPAHIVTRLGFGHADVVCAVPQAWLDVVAMADLADVAARFRLKHHRPMRVATKFVSLTRRFLTAHGVSDYVIVESPGATEGAPAAGSAEFIVDITSTGRTLAENGLKVLDDGVMLKSEACLVASLKAPWPPEARTALAAVLARIAADAAARAVKRVEVTGRGARRHAGEAEQRFGARIATVHDEDRVTLLVPRAAAHACGAWLVDAGAERVSVSALELLFEADNALHDTLVERLDRAGLPD